MVNLRDGEGHFRLWCGFRPGNTTLQASQIQTIWDSHPERAKCRQQHWKRDKLCPINRHPKTISRCQAFPEDHSAVALSKVSKTQNLQLVLFLKYIC